MAFPVLENKKIKGTILKDLEDSDSDLPLEE